MTRAAHSEEYTRESRPVLYIAFELGAKEWKLGFTTDLAATVRVRVMPAREVGRVRRELTEAKEWYGLAGTAAVRSCYEAGRDGFWLHRWLTREGIDNRVVDSSSIEVNRRQRRAKSDGLDARKLVGMLVRYHAGEPRVWSVLRVPTVAAEDGRQLHRALRTLKQDLARVTNRIKGLLATQGIGGGPRGALGGDLEEVRGGDGEALPAGLRQRLQRERAHAEFLQGQIRELEGQRRQALAHAQGPALEQVRRLLRLRAIGVNGAWVFVNECFGWRQFSNRKEVGAAAGLTPTPYQSGEGHREQGISKAGSRHLRAVAIETAWGWLRYQPESRLSRWYQERFGRGGTRARKVGIVALARKLLVELWRYLEHGVIPDGAVLKA